MQLEIKTFKKHESNEFNPYSCNSGTSMAIKGKNFIIIASDMRHTSEYTINSRNTSKIFKIKDYFLATTGFYADSYEVSVKLNYNVKVYEMLSNKEMNIAQLAHLNFNTLYNKRFFPHYSYCIICGFDKESKKPMVYAYDPVGSYDSVNVKCNGTSASIIQPILDTYDDKIDQMNEEDVMKVIKSLFESASERDVRTGDLLELVVIKEDGYKRYYHELRKD
ncbi:hypothetical protein H312_00897 [Anncaliia algerae PRA339]|uniref:Proteasome subunit beta n=1 Tax=Anncaliia algerae PRA339 TaxID=1288291 RepID=A0A059F367_9MICR|nr:hypothetical protein H312_00897 [Anncaliia algerae PRA339]